MCEVRKRGVTDHGDHIVAAGDSLAHDPRAHPSCRTEHDDPRHSDSP